MQFKRFSNIFVLSIIIFLILNALIWNFSTKHILTRYNNIITGDLARLGYISKLIHPRINSINLTKKHYRTENYNFEKIDIVTLGDSFSNGAAGGKNRYYQDYISSYLNLNVLNIEPYKNNELADTINILLNSGFFKYIGVKYVIYESTQRAVVKRLTRNIDFHSKDTIKNIKKYYNFGHDKKNHNLELPKISFINNGNFKYLLFSLLRNFSDNAFFSYTYKNKLNKNLFSIEPENEILYFSHDLKSIKKNTKQNLKVVNNTLNKLAKKLKEQNIKLIFMPAVSKYDLYSKFIVNNKHPKDQFFTIFRKLKKDYIFIDTKAILLKELENGKKDIFYVDDTHWSYKASDAIAKHLKSLLQPEQ